MSDKIEELVDAIAYSAPWPRKHVLAIELSGDTVISLWGYDMRRPEYVHMDLLCFYSSTDQHYWLNGEWRQHAADINGVWRHDVANIGVLLAKEMPGIDNISPDEEVEILNIVQSRMSDVSGVFSRAIILSREGKRYQFTAEGLQLQYDYNIDIKPASAHLAHQQDT